MRDVSQAVNDVLAKRASVALDMPVLQPAGLYLELAGEDIRKRAFIVADAQGEEVCLRPDLTVPACRAALELDHWDNNAPFAVRYEGMVFRRRTETTAGATEFVQAGAEWFSPLNKADENEAEIVVAAIEACRAAGVEPALHFGDVGLFRGIVAACRLPFPWGERLIRAFSRPGGVAAALEEATRPSVSEPSALAEALAALPEDRAAAAVEEVLSVAGIEPVGGRSVADVAQRLREGAARSLAPRPSEDRLGLIRAALEVAGGPEDALDALERLTRQPRMKAPPEVDVAITRARALWKKISTLTKPPAETRFSVGLGRGLAYYDGFVFELEAPKLGGRKSLGGGGRYDGLLHAMAQRSPRGNTLNQWSAAGFAVRPKRLAEAAS